MVCETESASVPGIGKLIGLRYFYNVPTEHPSLIVGSAQVHISLETPLTTTLFQLYRMPIYLRGVLRLYTL